MIQLKGVGAEEKMKEDASVDDAKRNREDQHEKFEMTKLVG